MTRLNGVLRGGSVQPAAEERLPDGFQLDAETNAHVDGLAAAAKRRHIATARQRTLLNMIGPAAEACCEVPIPFALDCAAPAAA